MNVPYKLCIHKENNIDILVYLFDANHCPGILNEWYDIKIWDFTFFLHLNS